MVSVVTHGTIFVLQQCVSILRFCYKDVLFLTLAVLKVQPIVIKSGRPSEINIDRNGNTDVKVKLPPEVLRSNTLGKLNPFSSQCSSY